MGGRHGIGLARSGGTVVHRLPAHVKVVALLGYLMAVIGSPREFVWPYLLHLAALLAVVRAAGIGRRALAGGLALEAPFLVFAVALPFVATGPTTTLLGLTVSQAGLWAAWALFARATLGVVAAATLAATTDALDLVDGLRRLRVPALLVEIMWFMIRYADVVADQARRMGHARQARGFRHRTLRSWPTLGRSLGALFIRAYERGERVHRAMLARGYTGSVPVEPGAAATTRQWALAASLPAAAGAVAVLAWVLP